MWPFDDDDDEGWEDLGLDDGDEDDEEEVIARVEAAYRSERARLRASSDVTALREMQANYEDQLAAGELPGVAGMRARDLVELIEERVDALEAARRARVERTEQARREGERRAEQAKQRVRESKEAERRQREEAERQARDRARRVSEDERAAAARLANARAAEGEARATVLRARAARAARAPASAGAAKPVAGERPKAGRRSELERVVTAPVVDAPAATPIEEADRAALMSVGRWPPPEARPDSWLWSPDAHWPKEWNLTGFDLAMFRGRLNVSQRVLAGQLGGETVEIARAEAGAREKVRPALQVALIRALAEYRRDRPQRAAPAAPSQATPALTGAELSRFRAERGLSQRQAAELLGVAHGTVAKAELAPDKALGEKLSRALRAAIRR